MSNLATSLAIFGAGVGFASTAIALVPAVTETVVAKVLPAGQPQAVHRTLMLVYALLGTSTETDVVQWKSYVVSYSLAAFPSLATVPEIVEYCTMEVISPALCQMLTELNELLKSATSSEAAIVAALQAICTAIQRKLPVQIAAEHVNGIVDSIGLRTTYAHFSLVVYLAAKVITDANQTQMTEARPRAIISAFLLYEAGSPLPEGIVSILNGDMMLSSVAHHGIHRAWFEMSAFRRHGLAPILVSATHGRQIAFEVMHVTVSMMRWAQMSHAVFIAQLLAAEPWLETYAPLAAQVQLFKTSAERLKELPAAEVEFTRVIHGNRVGLFRRRDLAGLVECALSDLRATTPTVGAYFSDPSYAPTVLAYQTEKARQHAIRAATGGSAPLLPAAAAAAVPPPVVAPTVTPLAPPAAAPAPAQAAAPDTAPMTSGALPASAYVTTMNASGRPRVVVSAPGFGPIGVVPAPVAAPSADLLQLDSSVGLKQSLPPALLPTSVVAGPSAGPEAPHTAEPSKISKKQQRKAGKQKQTAGTADQERMALLEEELKKLRAGRAAAEDEELIS